MRSRNIVTKAIMLSSLVLSTGLLVAQGRSQGHGRGGQSDTPSQSASVSNSSNAQTGNTGPAANGQPASTGNNVQSDNDERPGQDQGHAHKHDHGKSEQNGAVAGSQSANIGPSQRPPGWDKGKKVGWGNCDMPPGLAMKSGCNSTQAGQVPATLGDAARAQRNRRSLLQTQASSNVTAVTPVTGSKPASITTTTNASAANGSSHSGTDGNGDPTRSKGPQQPDKHPIKDNSKAQDK